MPSGAGTLTIYTKVDQSGLNAGINSITRSMNKLANTMKMALGVVGFIQLGKSAIDAASHLQEYSNVAEVTFGKFIYKLDELTKVSIKAYGMSRLTATEAASGFMAMGDACGIAKDKASDMAIELTKYMADFASFHDLGHERARTALAAVYTGETETLKQYGIMLQEVNLQQYENTYGLGRSIKTMTAAEKTQLRFNYVMHVGKDAMGDFVRTSGNWANQTRVLKELWSELLIKLGNGLITVLTPLVRVMNELILVTMNYVDVLGDALTVIFGIDWQDLASQRDTATESADDAIKAEEEYADAVSKSAKSTNKALQSFDKLNVIRTTSSSSSSSVKMDDLDAGVGLMDKTTDKVQSAIDSLYKLGQFLGNSLVETLNKIDWNSVYTKFISFGQGVADFLNGWFSTSGLSAIAGTIANFVNAVAKMLLQFVLTFDWAQLGMAIADAINTLFGNLDTEGLAELVNRFIDGIKELLVTTINNTDWSGVLESIKSFFDVLELDTLTILIGAVTIPKLMNLIGKAIAEAIYGATKRYGFGEALATLFGGGLLNTGDLIGRLADAIALTAGGAGTLHESLVTMIGPFATTVSGIFSMVSGAIMAITNFVDMLKNGFSWINEILMVIGVSITALGTVILGIVTGPVAAIVAAIVAAVMTIVVVVKDNWNTIVEFCENLWERVKTIFGIACDWVSTNIINPILDSVSGFTTRVAQFFEGLWLIIQALWICAKAWFTNWINKFVDMFTPIAKFIGIIFQNAWNIVESVWGSAVVWFSKCLIEPLQNRWKTFTEHVGKFFTVLWSGMAAGATNVMNGIISIIESALNWIIGAINKSIEGFNHVAKWASNVVGKDYGGIDLFSEVTLKRISVPKLATGAVIPPNKEFMAILGDQKHGTNIEAPLDTIKQALAEVMSQFGGTSNNGDIVVQIDGREVFRAVRQQNRDYINRTGSSAFSY